MTYPGIGSVRHTLDTNWDRLRNLSNYHELIRSTVSARAITFIEEEKMKFNYLTITDNANLLGESLLEQINQLVVESGCQLIKKRRST